MPRETRNDVRHVRPRSTGLGYVVVVVSEILLTVCLIFLMRVLPLAHFPIPYVLLTMAIAYVFGEGPAVASVVLGWFLFTYMLVPPRVVHWPPTHSIEDVAAQVALLLGMIVVGSAILQARRSGLRIQQLNDSLELRNAELDTERARWQGVVEGIADEVWVCDAQGRMSLINLVAVTPMGLETFRGRSVYQVLEAVDVMYPDGQPRPPEQAPLIRSLRGEIVRGEEIMRHRQTGHTRYRQFSSAPIRDAVGEITGAVAIVRDITDQKQTEEALRESEQRLRAAFDNAALGIVEVDTQDHLIAANDRACQILGYSPEELLAMNVHELTYTEDQDTSDDMNARLHQGLFNMFDYEKRYRKHDGSPLWVHVTVSAIRDSEGRHLRSIGTFEDISERRAAQEALRESEERLRLAQQAASIGTFEWNIVTGVNTWTPELEAMYGLEPGGFPGTQESWENLVYWEDRDEAVSRVSRALETGGFEAEFRVVWPDGTIRWLNGRAWVFKDESGNPLRLIGVNIDVTDRKQAEEALRKSEERQKVEEAVRNERQRLFDVLETLPAMVCLLTTDYHVAFANRSFRERFGESHGRFCYEFCFGHGEPCEFCESYRVLETGQPHHWEVNAPNGSVIAAYDYPFTDVDGSPMILEMDIDITEQRRTEAALRERTAELEDTNKEIEAFSYSVSHDLRAPLRAIDGFSRTLLDNYRDSLDADGQDYLDRVGAAAQRMSQLIDDILGLSRAGRVEMHCRQVDVSEMASEVLRELQESQPERRAEIIVQPELMVYADPNLFRIVLDNLLGNAWKFTGKRGVARIEVGSIDRDSERIYYVRDNGAGFNPERADKLFVPFQRLHSDADFAGTGIGLALVQRIIRRHGGRVWAEGEVGKGATFYFTLGEADN